MQSVYKKAYVSYAIAFVMIFMFFLETFSGESEDLETAIRFGAMAVPLVLEKQEYYRLFTSMFLHFGPEHLSANLISVLAVGPYIEKIFGRISYLLIFVLSGIGGNLLSMVSQLIRWHFPVSTGASGAAFGLFGAILLLSLLPRFRPLFPLKNVVVGIALNLGIGLFETGIDAAAHLGGLICGFLTAAVILVIRRAAAGAR